MSLHFEAYENNFEIPNAERLLGQYRIRSRGGNDDTQYLVSVDDHAVWFDERDYLVVSARRLELLMSMLIDSLNEDQNGHLNSLVIEDYPTHATSELYVIELIKGEDGSYAFKPTGVA